MLAGCAGIYPKYLKCLCAVSSAADFQELALIVELEPAANAKNANDDYHQGNGGDVVYTMHANP